MSRRKITRTEIILITALVIVTAYLTHYKISTEKKLGKIAETPIPECANLACYESIIEISSFVDNFADVCEDFHQFVCGHFFETAYKNQVISPILEEQEKLTIELEAMIVGPISSQDSEAIKIQKLFYQACVKRDTKKGATILGLIEKIGGWPLIMRETWKGEKDFDWIDMMIKCKSLGLPFQWFLEIDSYVYDGFNYLQVSFPKNSKKLSLQEVKSIISNLVGEKIDVREIIEFGKHLVNATQILHCNPNCSLVPRNSELSLITIGELQEKHSIFKWLDFVKNITNGSFNFTEETQIATNAHDYIFRLHQLLIRTSKHIQANYIIWKIVEYFAPYISNQVSSEVCKEKTREIFPYFSEVEYIRKYSTEEVKSSANDLKDAIQEEFTKRIEESTWWNTTAAQMYLFIFDNTTIDIGIDLGSKDETLGDEFLEANYWRIGNLNFEQNSTIVKMITERWKNYFDSLFSNINTTGIELEEKELSLRTNETNVFFHDSLNKMVVPPSVLHGFLYELNRPNFLNFAGLGQILAKEFIKSLQMFTERDENVTNAAFQTSNRCFEEDLLELISDKINVKAIVEENVPDIVARDIAYSAYQNWVSKNGEEDPLPLLSYTPNQLFWIKTGLLNCHKPPEENFEVISKYKNILSARHSRHFPNDFGCPEKTAMNPSKKC